MYKVAIRNNATGEVAIAEIGLDWKFPSEEDSGDIFWWTEGNMGCDCNRELEWRRAKDEEIPDDFDYECGDGRFSVLYAELPDGERVSIDE